MRHSPGGMPLVRAAITASLLMTACQAALGLEMYPPWIHDCPKAKSPSAPPWVGHSKIKENSPWLPPWVGHSKIKDNSPWLPPWLNKNTVTEKSPCLPPWVGTECDQPELARDGFWGYPEDWRDVDWSQADSGAALHQSTQAVSLKVDAKLRGDKPPKPRDAILEYYWYPSPTGPGRIVK